MGVSAMRVNPHTGELYRGSGNGTWIFPGPLEYYPTDIKRSENQLPKEFNLKQNFPNPFNPTTNIEYDIGDMRFKKFNAASDFSMRNVTLKIYDILGREVKTLVNAKQSAGSYSVNWNSSGEPSGIYFYKLVVSSKSNDKPVYSDSKKMVLLK